MLGIWLHSGDLDEIMCGQKPLHFSAYCRARGLALSSGSLHEAEGWRGGEAGSLSPGPVCLLLAPARDMIR